MVTAPARIGSYRIERLLGFGSFATVWLGFDETLGAHVAIKVLAENWSHDLRVRERFLDEARLLWRLDHDRIVQVYALGELPDGRPYLVMAWADGGSLRDRLALAPLEVRHALALLREICAGVAVLHDNGIVHRDLTPGNVLFKSRRHVGTEQVVIADLGLAKALAVASGLTARAGTPGYMAPEQDDPLSIVDRRADVYGLGQLGVRLLGLPVPRRPDQPVRVRDGVPKMVADVLRTATAQRPGERYRDAAAFGAALDRATAGPARGKQAAGRAALGLVSLAIAGTLAFDAVGGRFTGEPGVVVDPSGRISVAAPAGWTVHGGKWTGPVEAGGDREPALVVAPEPDRWHVDGAAPGMFVWLSRSAATRLTPNEFLAGRPHARCTAAPMVTSRQAGIDWVVARFSGCPDGRDSIVEAAGLGPGDAGLVYAQIAPPAGSAPTFVDTLLAGVQVR